MYSLHYDAEGRLDGVTKREDNGALTFVPANPQTQQFCDFLTWNSTHTPRLAPEEFGNMLHDPAKKTSLQHCGLSLPLGKLVSNNSPSKARKAVFRKISLSKFMRLTKCHSASSRLPVCHPFLTGGTAEPKPHDSVGFGIKD